MAGRVRFELPKRCDCGAKGTIVFEEDDIRDRSEGGANTEVVEIDGPFERCDTGQIVCRNCEVSSNA